MDSEKLEMLETLVDMWNQYCGKNGHRYMSAGEKTATILIEYGLLKDEWSEADISNLQEVKVK